MKYGAAEGKMKENEDIGSSLFSNSCPLLYVPRLRRRGNQLLFSPPPEPSHPCRSPRRGRGLKLVGVRLNSDHTEVAPRGGGVD